MTTTPLALDALRKRCDPSSLSFTHTGELDPIDGLIGQARALDALEFGTGLDASGYNIFVLGSAGSGRHNAVRDFLRNKADQKPSAPDWVYVHNFDEPHRPKGLRLATGLGASLCKGLEAVIDGLKTAMPAVFEGEDYISRRNAIDAQLKAVQEQAFAKISEKATSLGLVLARTQQGFAVVPSKDGQPMSPEDFQKLSEEARKTAEANIADVQKDLQEAMQAIPKLDKDRRQAVRALNRQLAEVAVEKALDDLNETFANDADVKAQLDRIGDELANNATLFVQMAQQEADPNSESGPTAPLDIALNKYRANLLVSGSVGSAPVEYLDFPGLGHLLGRIEHIAHMGAMLTDFTLIKSGALHRANGGYLIIDAERLVQIPGAWQAVKRCLRASAIAIESPMTGQSISTTVTLEPEPIALDVKLVLIGQRQTFHMLQQADGDFVELFKVAVDFDEIIERTDDAVDEFCRLIGSIARKEISRDLTAGACAVIVEQASRLSDDQERLTLRVGILADLIREANYWADRKNAKRVGSDHVRKAIDEQVNRLDRIRERMHEQISRGSVLIDTHDDVVGQINGLSVLSIGSVSFGKPTRITARTRMGDGKLVDIEREVDLGGSLHSKGILILSGFLAARYAHDFPVSLAASLVFEQSYGGVDGDSASSTELYALLSSLSGVPIHQGLAVTGSVNQNGEVQVIGGVNQKIEGFFDICKSQGLTGKQGVLIPQANVKNLMLREDVVSACEDGQFGIYSVHTIDQGIEILTGRTAGTRQDDGTFQEGTINRLVEDKLVRFAKARQAFLNGAQLSV